MKRYLYISALLALGPAHSYADEPAAPAAEAPPIPAMIGTAPSPWRLGIAFGYGERTNPLIASDDIPIVVDLDIAWFGERFFFDNGDLGLTVSDNDAFTLSVVARINSDRVFFGRAETRFVSLDAGFSVMRAIPLEPPDRDYAVELGAEVLTDGNWGRLQLAAFHDVSSTHDGFEIFAEWSRGFRNRRWYLEPALGASFKSRRLNDYYFGLRPNETAIPGLEAILGDGVNLRARLAASYQITPGWSATVAAEYERLNDEAASSPIVEDNHVLGYFAGLHYGF